MCYYNIDNNREKIRCWHHKRKKIHYNSDERLVNPSEKQLYWQVPKQLESKQTTKILHNNKNNTTIPFHLNYFGVFRCKIGAMTVFCWPGHLPIDIPSETGKCFSIKLSNSFHQMIDEGILFFLCELLMDFHDAKLSHSKTEGSVIRPLLNVIHHPKTAKWTLMRLIPCHIMPSLVENWN